MRWIIVILWSIMPCYVALVINDSDYGIILTVIWTLLSIGGFAIASGDDEKRDLLLFKTWIIIHLLQIMLMIWYFNQP